MKNKLCILVCENFKKELAGIALSEKFDNVATVTFPARCGRPRIEWNEVEQIVRSCGADCSQVHLLGSCCIAGLEGLPGESERYRFHRLDQCFYLFAGREFIDACIGQGAYLMTPGWLSDWRLQMDQWGFDQETAREFFAESAERLLLLDTGVDEKSSQYLAEFADFAGRPSEIVPAGLDFFRLFLTEFVMEWHLENEKNRAATALNNEQRHASEHAMTMDLLGSLARTMTEADAIQNIIDTFTMFFAPTELSYIPLKDGEPGEVIRSFSSPPADNEAIRNRLAGFDKEYAWTESGSGFIVRISHRKEMLGLIEVEQVAFPEYKEKYLNLALSIIGVCGLAIDNARRYQQITEQKNQLAETLKELQRTKRQLVEAEKMAALGNLVAGVAHEINTPLGIGITASSVLVDRTKQFADIFKANTMKRSDLQSYLQSAHKTGKLILKNLQRTGELVQSFKQVSVDQASEQKRVFKLKCYLQDVIRSLEPKLKVKSLRIEIDCDETLELNSYPGIVAQIITNFLINSLTHGFQDMDEGQINIVARAEENDLLLEYRDNGKGISEDILPKIFDPFFTTNKQLGTGLGMHIVYNIITQKLKGSITCNSEPGNGVLFVISMPLNA